MIHIPLFHIDRSFSNIQQHSTSRVKAQWSSKRKLRPRCGIYHKRYRYQLATKATDGVRVFRRRYHVQLLPTKKTFHRRILSCYTDGERSTFHVRPKPYHRLPFTDARLDGLLDCSLRLGKHRHEPGHASAAKQNVEPMFEERCP